MVYVWNWDADLVVEVMRRRSVSVAKRSLSEAVLGPGALTFGLCPPDGRVESRVSRLGDDPIGSLYGVRLELGWTLDTRILGSIICSDMDWRWIEYLDLGRLAMFLFFEFDVASEVR
jgi:hypothetical protein